MTTPPLSEFHKAALQCEHDDRLLNPDAVAVKWFKCSKCGRSRREDIKAEKQKLDVKPIWSR